MMLWSVKLTIWDFLVWKRWQMALCVVKQLDLIAIWKGRFVVVWTSIVSWDCRFRLWFAILGARDFVVLVSFSIWGILLQVAIFCRRLRFRTMWLVVTLCCYVVVDEEGRCKDDKSLTTVEGNHGNLMVKGWKWWGGKRSWATMSDKIGHSYINTISLTI